MKRGEVQFDTVGNMVFSHCSFLVFEVLVYHTDYIFLCFSEPDVFIS